MHMADALLSPAVGATFWAGTAGAIAFCSKKIRESMDEKIIPLMGVLGAFIFAAQMINFSIPGTGSSGHLAGGIILAALVGPYAAFIALASVITVQALFFADGGILALGCNIWNMGLYACFIGYPLIFKPLVRGNSSPQRIIVASLLSAVVSLQLGAFSVVIETVLSGRSELPFSTFMYLMLPVHLAIGIVEGLATAGILLFVKNVRPEILESAVAVRPLSAGLSLRRVVLTMAVLAVFTGGMLSWFASANPDGLEWSIKNVVGKTELPEQHTGIATALKTLQEHTAFLPDYSFKKTETEPENKEAGEPEQPWPAVEAGTSVSGILGSVIVLGVVLLIGFLTKALSKRKT